MRKFLHDCRGAVTVFVTLLLIPATLICGMGVDLARVFTARSVVQDANQLAANSVLASYDAMLQDLYGLYGVMRDDPILAGMVDEYIRVSVFGEDWQDRGMGTFQLFYGSDLSGGEVTPAPGKNLKNAEVLRRQIEEYAKFRAPVIIVEELMGILDSFEKVKADAKIIRTKMELDDKVEEIDKLYCKIYEKIEEIHPCQQEENSAVESVNVYLRDIHFQLDNLLNTRDEWTELFREDKEEERREDLEEKYQTIQKNIASLVKGGTVYTGWIPGNWDENGVYDPGYWSGQYTSTGLNKSISDRIAALKKYPDLLDDLIDLCKKADDQKKELNELLDDMEEELERGKCSTELKEGLTTPPSEGEKSTMDVYRDLLRYRLEPMANAMAERDKPQIQAVIDLLDTVYFGDTRDGSPRISLENLKKLDQIAGFDLDLEIQNESRTEPVEDQLEILEGVETYTIRLPSTFELFQSQKFASTQNPSFYSELVNIYHADSDDEGKDRAKKAVTALFKQAQELFQGWTYEPEGAWKYQASGTGGSGGGFGEETDWSDEDAAKDETKNALSSDLLSRFTSFAETAGNQILLLTYDTEMFSCYATKGDGSETSMAGVPLGIDVNYYFQSELEYLYHGNLNDAIQNLKSVASMLFLVRFVFNYVASFSITQVNNTVNGIRASLSATGPFAVLIAELARAAFAMAESAIDVGALRSGHTVTLMKNNQTWRLQVDSILNTASGTAANISESEESGLVNRDDDGGLSYRDYMRLFLLMVDGDTLADRTAELISLNVTNKKENIGALSDRTQREEAMSAAQRVDLGRVITDFSLTTTVQLRMLFLSMPFAQRGVHGVVPPGTLELTVTDYRGY